ncbi:MAG: methyltransferase domain-containing protein [Elusimicrobiota bacterium]|jgi:demethylmenaquinone methyltransferase/2-methoxy-6-polyprenyl-1,4-benzoquinol methylase|nr:methyltransferase domain-containing protein [Elusimicrobiota bacterium]
MDKQKIAAFFNSIAATWDANERPGVYNTAQIIIDKIAPQPASKILDIGCGTGVLYPFLQAYNPSETLHVDLSENMLAEFCKKHPKAAVLCADFETARLKKNYFDYIIAYNVFPHFIDKQKVFDNAFSFLKQGGSFYIVHSMTREELQRVHGSNSQTEEDLLPPSAAMELMYLNAGFKNIVIEEKSPGFYSFGIKPA